MAVRLEKNDIKTLISLVTREIDGEGKPKDEQGFYKLIYSRDLVDIRNKLVSMLADADLPSSFSDEELPEFGQYAHRKYPAELDEDLITMIENLIERQRVK